LEDDEHTGQPRMVKMELKIQEVAIFVHANRSEIANEVAAAAGISNGNCHMFCVTQQCSTDPDAKLM
jgi:hypothetical protein